MESEKNNQVHLSATEALPGTQAGSDLQCVYEALASGQILTTLDAVFSNHTVCLTKYISLLRNKYGIPVKDRWVKVSKRKRVKEFWIDQ
ncbi:hypothetical protein [Bacteroides sp. 214]|uniref:hypothetical protein n=1 Tax=Bacteroides sp. 214 TaxID=2302935 RepID=UPI0013D7EDCC|nr:hypothetical protein [Bacteroides sp. 214]